MLVKCKICGTKNEKADSYCLIVNGKNNYYCSEIEYLNHKKELEFKDLFYAELCECFGYQIKNSMLWKETAELQKLYGFEVLYNTIADKKTDIIQALPRLVRASEINKIKYTFAIIQNNVKNTQEKLRRLIFLKETSGGNAFADEYEQQRYLDGFHIKQKKKRKCLMDFLSEYEED